MISLKKHIDSWDGTLFASALTFYRSLLTGVAKSSERAVPDLGDDLSVRLNALNEDLAKCKTVDAVSQSHQKAESEITQWAEKAYERHAESGRELKEIVGVLAKTMETVSERDTRYAKEVGDLSDRLRSISTLNDLTALRRSIVESAGALSQCVTRLNEESRESLRRLSVEVAEYRTKLDKSEKLSTIDALTGLYNRRAFEMQLEARISGGGIFSLILIDLNDFKSVNDRHGHLAGDELLKQFAEELRSQFRLADLVSRWGGDEFAVIVNSNQKDTNARLHGLRRAALGEYKVTAGNKTVSVTVDASIGVVQWNHSETGKELLARADQSMYTGKTAKPRAGQVAEPRASVHVG